MNSDRVSWRNHPTYIADASKELIQKGDVVEATLKRFKKLEAEYKEMISAKRKEPAYNPRVTRNIDFTTMQDAAAPTTDPPEARPRAPYAVQLCNPLYGDSSGHKFMATHSENIVVETRILTMD
jgi:hypothetical protein